MESLAQLQQIAGAVGQVATPVLLFAGVVLTAVYAFRTKRVERVSVETVAEKETRVAEADAARVALADRFDDASLMAKYIREEVEKEVERQVAPIRRQSEEMNDAVRARETQLWLWDQRGRRGELPMLPIPILVRLGIAHFADPDFDDTENPYRPKT